MSRKAFGDLGQRRRRQIFKEIFRRADIRDGRQQDMQIERERSLSPHQRYVSYFDSIKNYLRQRNYINIIKNL